MSKTKAQMLIDLANNIPDIHVLPILVVHNQNLIIEPDKVINDIILFADNRRLIIRSSSINEDTFLFSNAGKYVSVLDVEPTSERILAAMKTVVDSYYDESMSECAGDTNEEILIQPMLKSVIKSGVVFTRDINTNAEYYFVNYQEGSDTAAVTSGKSNRLRSFISYKKNPYDISDRDMAELITVVNKIEEYLSSDALDIEFAIDKSHDIFILQCRPLAKGKKNFGESVDLSPALRRIYKKVEKLSAPHPFLLGHSTCFGVMPDWNPAEILGARPRKLAISLYKELVTDSVWAHQRKNYGYRDLTMHPLMISFCGIPYVDTRISFNSFIPARLNRRIAEKLANYYIDTLASYPKYHDKIEFEIVYSCYYLGLPEKLKDLLGFGFNENEIRRIEYALLELTNRIIDPDAGLYRSDLKKIDVLESNYEKIVNSDISVVDKLYWLIEECKEYGTLPFAGVARAAFIAVQFLQSFVETGIISQEEHDLYMNGLNTVNRQMSHDLQLYNKGDMTVEEFLEIYGHIRPGTYDIMSKRYDEAFYEYFPPKLQDSVKDIKRQNSMGLQKEGANPVFTDAKKRVIQKELDENGLLIGVDDLLVFIRSSIEGRERVKFIFTKSVSKILQLIEELGKRVEISKEDMAHLDIGIIKQLYVDLYTGRIEDLFRQNIENNRKQYERAVQIKLPSIIVKPNDVYSFYLLDEEPNYITQKTARGRSVVFSSDQDESMSAIDCLEGSILFIKSADPGYDFVFSKNIAGLVTEFGGANSHMAIRCAELGVPAVIGVGESRWGEWSTWSVLELDCVKRQVIKIE